MSVEYLFYRNHKEGPPGYTIPGWYMWDGEWGRAYGPYESADAVRKILKT